MPWLKIHNPKTNWADGECIFQGDPLKVESISIEDFLDGVRKDPGQVFWVSIIDIEKVVAGKDLPD
jgi:hypothetical protein